MKKSALIISFIILIMISSIILLSHRNIDFGFEISHKYQYESIISTFNNSIKIYTDDGMKSSELQFTKRELKKIKAKFDELDIRHIDYSFLAKKYITFSSKSANHLIINDNGDSYTIEWTTENIPVRSLEPLKAMDGHESDLSNYMKLIEFENFIMKIIDEKDII